MLWMIAVLQAIGIVVGLLLFTRKPVAPAADPRLAQMPEEILALRVRMDATDAAIRSGLADVVLKQTEAAERQRGNSDTAATLLRGEVEGRLEKLGTALGDSLLGFRSENVGSTEKFRGEVNTALRELYARFEGFSREAQLEHAAAREVLHGKLTDLSDKNQKSHETLGESMQRKLNGLGEDQRQDQDRLRKTVQDHLEKLNQSNAVKLDEMRQTVDEKLNNTLHERLTASFGQVTEHLGLVQKGLGEMKEFATGVSDLKRVFSNVKARGIVGEFQLGMQLEQMFSPEQYVKNARIKEGSTEAVEFALKVPDGASSHVLLPIDAKFPREAYERLEHAHDAGSAAEQEIASREFEKTIRTEAKRICEKYIDPPTTLPFAVMFLPTEALYAEVMRRPGLHTELQSSCNVTIAGPSSFMAILTSFQMGFRTLAIQKKGNEVWKVLGRAKTEFGKFELLMNKVENNVKTVQNTLSDINVRTRAINRNLKEVTDLPSADDNAALLAVEEFAAVAPLVAASSDQY